MIFVRNQVLGGSRCPPPGVIGGKQIIYDYTTKYMGVARSDPISNLKKKNKEGGTCLWLGLRNLDF
jgi:hypothetical protein